MNKALKNWIKIANFIGPQFSTHVSKNFGQHCGTIRRFAGSASAPQDKKLEKRLVEKRVQVEEDVINYAQWGQGGHVVLCMPGMFGTIQTDFEPVVLKFNESKFTVIAWDPPGCGKSRMPGKNYPKLCRRQIQDARAAHLFMDKLGFDKYSIVGWSNGAATAVHLITQYANPGKIRRFVTYGAPAFTDDWTKELGKLMCDFKNWQPNLLAQFLEIYGEKTFQVMLNDLKDFILEGRFNIRPLLSKVEVPTLVLHGNKDLNCSQQHARTYKDGIKNSRLEIWPGASHYGHLEFPDKFVKTVEKFLLEDPN